MILENLEKARRFKSAQELHAELLASGNKVGLATVYRQLQALSQAGLVDSLRTEQGQTMYRRCVLPDHHHHLICTGCGTTLEFSDAGIERSASTLASARGFRAVSHKLEIFGICPTCSRAEEGR
jgi:Fur family ferric uptake transcriptional regulator